MSFQLPGRILSRLVDEGAFVRRGETLATLEDAELSDALRLARAEGVTVFVATTYLEEAERCGRVGLLHRGRLLACDTPQGLKKLMKGGVLELATNDPRRAARLLSKEFPSGSVALFGERLHLYAPEPGEALRQAASTLRADGPELTSVREVEPSLEDLFVSLIS